MRRGKTSLTSRGADERAVREAVIEILRSGPLHTRGLIKELRRTGIVSSPNKILDILRKMEKSGDIIAENVKGGRGPPRRMLRLSGRLVPLPAPPNARQRRLIRTAISKTLRGSKDFRSLEQDLQELINDPPKYWVRRISGGKPNAVLQEAFDSHQQLTTILSILTLMALIDSFTAVTWLTRTTVWAAIKQPDLSANLSQGEKRRRLFAISDSVETRINEIAEWWKEAMREYYLSDEFLGEICEDLTLIID
jgi:hypothetical protein